MGFVIAIPARLAATRLAEKPLQLLGGEPLICRVVRRALAAGADDVVVATDDPRVVDAVSTLPVRACLTSAAHASGSDRLAECATRMNWPDDTIVVNLQGDEPFAPVACIHAVVDVLAHTDNAVMATLATPIAEIGELRDPNCVKLVRALNGQALYFSRAPMPWARDDWASGIEQLPPGPTWLRHVGLYAYRAGFLRQFSGLPPTPLEQIESLEQLRALEHGFPISVAMAPEAMPPGIDTEADLARAEAELRRQGAHGL